MGNIEDGGVKAVLQLFDLVPQCQAVFRVQRGHAAQRADFLLHADDILHLFEEPDIDLRDVVDQLVIEATAECLSNDPDPAVIHVVKLLF